MTPVQIQIFRLSIERHLRFIWQRTRVAAAPRMVDHHGAIAHQDFEIAREPCGVRNYDPTAAVAELAEVYGYATGTGDRSCLHR
jgi:hypothetical protein